MLRACLSVVAGMAICIVGSANVDAQPAAQPAASQAQGKHPFHATITKVDQQKDTVTVKMTDKNGKEQDKTLHLGKGINYLNSSGKTAKLDDFRQGDEVCITANGDMVTEMKKDTRFTITKMDAKAGTVTVKTNDNGKDVERTFHLTQDAEYVDSTGRVAALDVFRAGDEVLLIEAEGKLKELKKAPAKNTTR